MIASFFASLCPLLPFYVLSRNTWDAILGCFVSLTSGVHKGPSQKVSAFVMVIMITTTTKPLPLPLPPS